MLQVFAIATALFSQTPGAADLDHGAIFPEGRYVERNAEGALQCVETGAASITIRVRQVQRLDWLVRMVYQAEAGLVSFNLDGNPEPQPLYAISEAELEITDGLAGDILIGAARITTAGRYADSVFDGGTTGALSLTLRPHEDGDFELTELWENDRRGLHSAAAFDRRIVSDSPSADGSGILAATGRALRRFGSCPDLPQ